MSTPAWSPALERKAYEQYPDNRTYGSCNWELFKFSLLWRLVRDVDSPAPGCGHQCFKELSAFVRLCISPKLVKFVVYFSFRTSFLFLTLHIQILSLGTVLSALLGQVGSTDCLFLSRLAPAEFALCCMLEKKKRRKKPTTETIQEGAKERISVPLRYLLMRISVTEAKFLLSSLFLEGRTLKQKEKAQTSSSTWLF